MESCIALAGPTTTAAKVGAAACVNVTDSESKMVSEMRTTDKIIIRGGSK